MDPGDAPSGGEKCDQNFSNKPLPLPPPSTPILHQPCSFAKKNTHPQSNMKQQHPPEAENLEERPQSSMVHKSHRSKSIISTYSNHVCTTTSAPNDMINGQSVIINQEQQNGCSSTTTPTTTTTTTQQQQQPRTGHRASYDVSSSTSSSNNRLVNDSGSGPPSSTTTDPLVSYNVMRKYLDRIGSLELELSKTKLERDTLAEENERLCFQLQMINEDIKQQRRESRLQCCLPPPPPPSSSLATSTSLPYYPASPSASPSSTSTSAVAMVINHEQHEQYGGHHGAQAKHSSCSDCARTTATHAFSSTAATTIAEHEHSVPVSGVDDDNRSGGGSVSPSKENNNNNIIHHHHHHNHRPCLPLDTAHRKQSLQPFTSLSTSKSCSESLQQQASNNSNVQRIHYVPPGAACCGQQQNVVQCCQCCCSLMGVDQGNGALHHVRRASVQPSMMMMLTTSPRTPPIRSPTFQEQRSPVGGGGSGGDTSSLFSRTSKQTGGSTSSLTSVSGTVISNAGSGKMVPPSSPAGSTTSTAKAGYEISQQLLDKQVSILERKYGGGNRAREAAVKIQRAYRSYRLQKRFTCLAMQAVHQKAMLQKAQEDAAELEKDSAASITAHFDEVDQATNIESLANVPEGVEQKDSDLDESLSVPPPPPPPPLESIVYTSLQNPLDHHHHFVSQPSSSTTTAGTNQFVPYMMPQVDKVITYEPVYPIQTIHHPMFHQSSFHQQPPQPSQQYFHNTNNSQYNFPPQHAHHHQQSHAPPPPQPPLSSLQKKSSFSSNSSTASSSCSLHQVHQQLPPSQQQQKQAPQRPGFTTAKGTMLQQAQQFSQPRASLSIQNNNNSNPLQRRSSQQVIPGHHHPHQNGVQQANRNVRVSPEMVKQLAQAGQNGMNVSFSGVDQFYHPQHQQTVVNNNNSLVETVTSTVNVNSTDNYRKRRYRIGLNLFNKNPPERGIRFLIDHGFIEYSQNDVIQAQSVARFLLTRKGLSKQIIGEYISEPGQFNRLVLKAFVADIDLSGMVVDEALRKFQLYFRFPGEAQKIERIVESFADQYKECNEIDVLSRDSVFILAFAIIMLNTDLHKATNAKHRMTVEQFLKNLKGVFAEGDLSPAFLSDIYKRIRKQELQTGQDHVTQVVKVQSTIIGRDVPNLPMPHRRLVCYCRLYEIQDLNRKEKIGQHQRDVFLFNDLLLITKTTSRSRNGQLAEYQYRSSIPLDGLLVNTFYNANYQYGIRIMRRAGQTLVALFNARNDLDQQRFYDDLQESILEMDEMEQLRITKSGSLAQLNSIMLNQSDANKQSKHAGMGTESSSATNSSLGTTSINSANLGLMSCGGGGGGLNDYDAHTIISSSNGTTTFSSYHPHQVPTSTNTASTSTIEQYHHPNGPSIEIQFADSGQHAACSSGAVESTDC